MRATVREQWRETRASTRQDRIHGEGFRGRAEQDHDREQGHHPGAHELREELGVGHNDAAHEVLEERRRLRDEPSCLQAGRELLRKLGVQQLLYGAVEPDGPDQYAHPHHAVHREAPLRGSRISFILRIRTTAVRGWTTVAAPLAYVSCTKPTKGASWKRGSRARGSYASGPPWASAQRAPRCSPP